MKFPTLTFFWAVLSVFSAAQADPFSLPEAADVPAIYKPLYASSLNDAEVKSFRVNLPYESVTLERTPCFGICPVYTVTLYRSGKAELHAKSNLPRTGDFVGEVDVISFGRLCYLLDRFHFNDFKDSYDAHWTDDTTCIVRTETRTKVLKKVSDYGRVGPIELWAIQQLIDQVREHIEWKPKSE